MKIVATGLIAASLLAMTAEAQAFGRDEDRDFGWGAPHNSHLDSYSGRPLGPPLSALPPGYDYYNGRLIRLPYAGGAQVYVPRARPRHSVRPKRWSSSGRAASRRR
jgi:hypothetical protein